MVRSAITPFQERACVIWLENHFEVYGDKAPNKHEIQLSVSIKKEVFEMYEEEQNKFGLESVKYNTFVNLCVHFFQMSNLDPGLMSLENVQLAILSIV
jgi:hypothetical protein